MNVLQDLEISEQNLKKENKEWREKAMDCSADLSSLKRKNHSNTSGMKLNYYNQNQLILSTVNYFIKFHRFEPKKIGWFKKYIYRSQSSFWERISFYI